MTTEPMTIDMTPPRESWANLVMAFEQGIESHKKNIAHIEAWMDAEIDTIPSLVEEAVWNLIGEFEGSIAQLEEELAQPWALSVKGQ